MYYEYYNKTTTDAVRNECHVVEITVSVHVYMGMLCIQLYVCIYTKCRSCICIIVITV